MTGSCRPPGTARSACTNRSSPAYRGFAPVNWAVINGEPRTGVTLFHMTATGIDDGDVVGQTTIPIGEHDTAGAVYRATARASLDLLDAHFDRLLDGTAPRTPQDESRATHTCSRTPEDGAIDWARQRGDPQPGAGSGTPLSGGVQFSRKRPIPDVVGPAGRKPAGVRRPDSRADRVHRAERGRSLDRGRQLPRSDGRGRRARTSPGPISVQVRPVRLLGHLAIMLKPRVVPRLQWRRVRRMKPAIAVENVSKRYTVQAAGANGYRTAP